LVNPCHIGVDVGTSGCRAVAVNRTRTLIAQASTAIPAPVRVGDGGTEQAAEVWWQAMTTVLHTLAGRLAGYRPATLCLDGTSATLLLCEPDGTPLGPALMYNDARALAEAERIARVAPPGSPSRGTSGSLAKLLYLRDRLDPPGGTLALHQADWLLGRLTGRYGLSDWNNALKLGYDPAAERWPDWLGALDLGTVTLPSVLAPGTPVGALCAEAAAATALPRDVQVSTGTTDSTAAVIAAGARMPGDAVTALGSTLVVKVLSRLPIGAPEYGVYSHRFGDLWLVGGASNSGGTVLRQFFRDAEIAHLSERLRPDEPTGLGYYPLPGIGERFPVADPRLAPRVEPRPAEDWRFLQGLLEGIAAIEAAGYERLRALGAPAPRRVLTVGGGAPNAAWTRIRERLLGVPVTPAPVQEAAYGAALLGLWGGVQGDPRC
jgi:sugar (pentulose or hexulose) kinase